MHLHRQPCNCMGPAHRKKENESWHQDAYWPSRKHLLMLVPNIDTQLSLLYATMKPMHATFPFQTHNHLPNLRPQFKHRTLSYFIFNYVPTLDCTSSKAGMTQQRQ